VTAPRTTRTKEEVIKDFRTEEIVRAARRVIGESGFDDASMERIAHEAGISKGTIYLYFRGKEDLLAHVADFGFGELMERAQLATERERGTEAKLAGLLRAALEHAGENREMFRVIQERTQLGFKGESLLAAKLERNREELLGFVTGLVERGAKSGDLRVTDGRRTARFLIECLRGAITDRVKGSELGDVESDAAGIVDFFLHGVGARGRK